MATATIKMRRDTLINWEAKNPILSIGEFGVITTINGTALDVKIGNGVDAFKVLPYFNPSLLASKADKTQVLTNVPLNAVFTDTVYTKPLSEPISYITNLQSILDAKVLKETGKALIDSVHYNSVTLDVSNLKTEVTRIGNMLNSPDISLDDLNEIVAFIKSNRSLLNSLSIAGVIGLQTALDGKVDDSQVLTNVPLNAVFTDTLYEKPIGEPISYIIGLQSQLDNKVPAVDGFGLVNLATQADVDLAIEDILLSFNTTNPIYTTFQSIGDGLSGLETTVSELSIPNIAGLQSALDLKANILVPKVNTEFVYNIDCLASTYFSQTVTSAGFSQSFTNLPASGTPLKITITLTNGGSGIIVWSPSVKWAGGVVPTFTVAGIDTVEMYTIDGGVTWLAKAILNYA